MDQNETKTDTLGTLTNIAASLDEHQEGSAQPDRAAVPGEVGVTQNETSGPDALGTLTGNATSPGAHQQASQSAQPDHAAEPGDVQLHGVTQVEQSGPDARGMFTGNIATGPGEHHQALQSSGPGNAAVPGDVRLLRTSQSVGASAQPERATQAEQLGPDMPPKHIATSPSQHRQVPMLGQQDDAVAPGASQPLRVSQPTHVFPPAQLRASPSAGQAAKFSARTASPAALDRNSSGTQSSARSESEPDNPSRLKNIQNAPVVVLPGTGGGSEPPMVSDSIRSAATFGWVIIFLFFGVLGGWAVTAPLHGAVVAHGFVKVETNRKSVQHLDGGIVKELRVKEGDRVAAGDVLIVLDDTQARAEHDVLWQQYLVLRATEARLRAEFAQRPKLTIPDEIKKALVNEGNFSEVWRGQIKHFEARLAALAGQREVIREKVEQLKAQITGGEAQVKAYKAQLASVKKELESLKPLVERGLISQPRYLQLERSGTGLEGQTAETIANIAKAREAIAEQMQQMAQLDKDRMTEVSKELRDTQAKLLEVIPRLMNAKAVLSRTEIRSPYTGRVVGLTAFSVGGVIAKGEKILDVVPEQESLVIEAQVAVDDISEMRPNMRADVHLTAYKARITPVLRGTTTNVSADRLTDERTGKSYYTALVRVDQGELAALPNIRLYPGMPATVMFPTVERTAFDYLMGPLVMSFNRAFREK